MKRLLIVMSLVALLLGPGQAALAEVKVGGDLRLEFSYGFYNDDWDGVDEYFGLHLFDAGDAFFRINYLSDDKKFSGLVMIGVDSRMDDNTVFTRQAYMQYNAEGWSIRFGQSGTICDRYWSNQLLEAALGLDGYGKVYFDRNEAVRLSVGEEYRFMFTLENPYNGSVWEGGHSYYTIPAVAASAELNFGSVQVNPWVHFENVQWEDGNDSDSYSSLDFGLGITGDFGLIGFTVAAGYGINTAQETPVLSGDPLVINNEVDDDVRQFSVWAELRVEKFSIGYGYARSERDDWSEDPYTQAAFASYKIPFGPMEFIPEVVWFDNGEDGEGADQGEAVLVGVSCHMEF